MKNITMYVCKNLRKNAKCEYMDKKIYKGENFTIEHMCDYLDKLVTIKNAYGWHVVRYCAFDENFNIVNFSSKFDYSSIESTINSLGHYMNYLNDKDNQIDLKELFNNSRIKYYINKYYHS